ncbi:hypothetical protein BS78_02G162200 [Paspalum vaginatum]|nr:hypothetical protein BS78_02G162200 [Paspalum vaginatum]
MASSSSFLLAAAVVALLVVAGSCGSALTFRVGEGSSPTNLALETNGAISEVSIKEKGAMDWSDDLKESPANTWTFNSKERIKGPISVRFSVKNGGYRVVDDIIPAGFQPGSVYKTGVQI